MGKNKKEKKNKVLYFDDEPFVSEKLAQSLKLLGWDITFVSEINDVFEELYNNEYNIIILDIIAPIPEKKNDYVKFTHREIKRMDNKYNTGIVLAKKIWEIDNGRFKDKPILFLSAKMSPDIQQFISEGKKCYCIRKPELARIISSKIQELIDNK